MGEETDSPGERAVKVMRIVEAIYRSAGQGGQQVSVPGDRSGRPAEG